MPKAAACKRIARNAKGLQERRVQFSRNKEKRKAEAGTDRGDAHRMRFSRSGGYAEEGYEFGVLLGKDELHHRLHRTRPAEHIDALYLFGFIAAFGEDLRIAGERGRAAGDVDHAARRG